MGKINVKYFVTKKVNGKEIWYWQPKRTYFVGGEWKRCPLKPVRLRGKIEDAIREAEEFNTELKMWRDGEQLKKQAISGTFHWLTLEYYKDEMYTGLADSTRRAYREILNANVLPVFGDIPCSKITRQHARAFYNSLIETPRTAEYAVMVARRVLHFGRNIGIISENPFTEMGIKKKRKRENVWLPEQIEGFLQKALEMKRPSMWVAMKIASTLGTDRSTTRLLHWESYDGENLSYSRNKTGVKMKIPLASIPHVKEAIDSVKQASPHIVTSEATSRGYGAYNFNDVFRRIADAAGIPRELQFKDLRRTAVGNLHRAGCTVPEIASVTGWSIGNCHEVIRHYFTDTAETAGNALEKLRLRSEDQKPKSWK